MHLSYSWHASEMIYIFLLSTAWLSDQESRDFLGGGKSL